MRWLVWSEGCYLGSYELCDITENRLLVETLCDYDDDRLKVEGETIEESLISLPLGVACMYGKFMVIRVLGFND